MGNGIDDKYLNLKAELSRMGKVLIAFSGGVDSSLLLKVAADVLKPNVLAVSVKSETVPKSEIEDAVRLAAQLGVRHILVEGREMDNPEFVQNPPDKCYICKKQRYGELTALAEKEGFPFVLDGENRDDSRDYRPGIRARKERGVLSPLSEVGFTKADIRELSRRLGLSTWDKPSYACLASRIPYYQEITAEKLKAVDAGEQFLRQLGLSGQIRVRHHGDLARIELSDAGIQRAVVPEVREKIAECFRTLGFEYVTLDIEGYVMGSLNRNIDTEASGE